MSKIIVRNIPASGHVNPTLPIVQELAQRSEQVLYYTTEEFRPYPGAIDKVLGQLSTHPTLDLERYTQQLVELFDQATQKR